MELDTTQNSKHLNSQYSYVQFLFCLNVHLNLQYKNVIKHVQWLCVGKNVEAGPFIKCRNNSKVRLYKMSTRPSLQREHRILKELFFICGSAYLKLLAV